MTTTKKKWISEALGGTQAQRKKHQGKLRVYVQRVFGDGGFDSKGRIKKNVKNFAAIAYGHGLFDALVAAIQLFVPQAVLPIGTV